MKYPTRCRIIDVSRKEIFPNLFGRTPEISKPHIGKFGLAEKDGPNIRITLDDGNILMGYECWWEPIAAKSELLSLAKRLADYVRMTIEVGHLKPDSPIGIAYRDFMEEWDKGCVSDKATLGTAYMPPDDNALVEPDIDTPFDVMNGPKV